MTIALVVLTVVLTWLLVSAVTAYFCTAVVRGGHAEDEVRGYVDDGPVLEARERRGDARRRSPRRGTDGMAES